MLSSGTDMKTSVANIFGGEFPEHYLTNFLTYLRTLIPYINTIFFKRAFELHYI